MNDMNESREAFEQWRDSHHYPKYPLDSSYFEFWQAAIQFERERLAKLADDRLDRSKAELDAGTLHVVSRIMVASLSADEIRAGKIGD